DGNDTIAERQSYGTADQLKLTDINSNEVTLVRDGNSLKILISESAPGVGDGGSIIIKDTLDGYFNRGVEQIVFADNVSWNRLQILDRLSAKKEIASSTKVSPLASSQGVYDNQVNGLIDAMAAFGVPAGSEVSMTQSKREAPDVVIAANWQ
ncbi:calcium-binding protein, partial [Phytopseudomonas flavescens]